MEKLSEDFFTQAVLNEKAGYYNEAYSQIYVHEHMLEDRTRTNLYKRAIKLNKHLFKDKIVLDVGCGTGILSMFAADAGAKLVIGVDCSEIAKSAEKIVKANNFENIRIVHSKIEEIKQLPENVEQVDIIISEWMGLCLFHESMLGTVVYARDRWLKPNGAMFPDRVRLFFCALSHENMFRCRIQRWDNVYGFKMKTLKNFALKEAFVETVNPKEIVSNSFMLQEVDLDRCSSDYSFKTSFNLNITEDSFIHAFLTYFDAVFTKSHFPFVLCTSPYSEPTHWKQTVFYIDQALHLAKNEEINVVFSLQQFKNNFRDLELEIEISTDGEYSSTNLKNRYILRG